jgi:hypothetical protein
MSNEEQIQKLRDLLKQGGFKVRKHVDDWCKKNHQFSITEWFAKRSESEQREVFLEDLAQAIELDDYSAFDATTATVATVNIGAEIRNEQANVAIKRSSDKQEGQAFNENNRDLKAVDENGKEFKPKKFVGPQATANRGVTMACQTLRQNPNALDDELKAILNAHGYHGLLLRKGDRFRDDLKATLSRYNYEPLLIKKGGLDA